MSLALVAEYDPSLQRSLALRSLSCVLVGVGLLLVTSASAGAQSGACPVVDGDVVSGALGVAVKGSGSSNISPGFDTCDFVDAAGNDSG